MRDFDPGDAVGSLRTAIRAIDRALAVLRPQLPVLRRRAPLRVPARHLRAALAAPARASCSSPPSASPTSTWHSVQQDVLLVLDPDDLDEPHAERLVGDDWVERADIQKLDGGTGLRGEERGDSPPSARPGWQPRRVSRRFALLVNPSRGRRAGAEVRCRRVHGELDRLGAPYRMVDDAQRRARRARRPRAAAAHGRDGRGARAATAWSACSPARCAARTGALGDHPRRPRQRLRARARRSRPTRPRPRASRSTARSGCRRRRRGRQAVRRHRQLSASTPTPTGSPTRPSS